MKYIKNIIYYCEGGAGNHLPLACPVTHKAPLLLRPETLVLEMLFVGWYRLCRLTRLSLWIWTISMVSITKPYIHHWAFVDIRINDGTLNFKAQTVGTIVSGTAKYAYWEEGLFNSFAVIMSCFYDNMSTFACFFHLQ